MFWKPGMTKASKIESTPMNTMRTDAAGVETIAPRTWRRSFMAFSMYAPQRRFRMVSRMPPTSPAWTRFV